MDTTHCTLDDRPYTVWEFNQLSPGVREQRRRHLICDVCGAKAYYRKASQDNKAACFGARPHNPGCDASSSNPTEDEQRDLEDVQQILAAGDEFSLNFELTLPAIVSEHQQTETIEQGPTGGSSQHHIKGPPQARRTSRGLKTLLNYLIRVPSFATSDTRIYTTPTNGWFAKNLLVRFEDAEHTDRFHMYWGMISDADDSWTWLNTGGRESVSILIEPPVRDSLLQAFQTDDPEYVAGVYAIVFGQCQQSQKSGKRFIRVYRNDPRFLFVKGQ